MTDSVLSIQSNGGLAAVLYRSRAVNAFDLESLRELATKATAMNANVGITGYLTYEDDCFTHYFEGPRKAVAELFEKISADPRHHIDTAEQLPVTDRRFPDWPMRLLDPMWHPLVPKHAPLPTSLASLVDNVSRFG